MALKLQDVLKNYKNNDDVRSILITAEGKAFCAGQDLNEAIDPNQPDITQIIEEHYNPIIRIIRSIEKPIIAAVSKPGPRELNTSSISRLQDSRFS